MHVFEQKVPMISFYLTFLSGEEWVQEDDPFSEQQWDEGDNGTGESDHAVASGPFASGDVLHQALQ